MEDLRKFILNLPQIVPESWCSECRICCRFPATENVQTPFWSPLEAEWARESGQEGDPSWFMPAPKAPSLSPRLVSCGESGYRCPAFEPGTNGCRIHAVKPLDCRLYPFVLARNSADTEVLLAMDPKCPFIERNQENPELLAYAARLAGYLDTATGMEYLRQNPQVVGPSWPEYLWVSALPRATAWIQGRPEAKPPHPSLRSVTEADLPVLREALRERPHAVSHYTLASLLGWSDLISLWWAPLRQGFALFAEQAGGLFLPVPPLGGRLSADQVRQAWEILVEANRGAGVSRVEGVETPDLGLFKELGFSLRLGEQEYLYAASALARLSGDGYRSQRWAVNRCSRSISFRIRPFEEADLLPCLQLYTHWAIRRQKESSDDLGKKLLRDGLFYHRRLMMERDRFGLMGRVLESEGKILAYTFGAAVSERIFCVFAEIAERSVPGLGAVLFREFCREIEGKGYRWVNAMGDAGLPALRRAKMAYRPARMEEVFTATWS